MGIYKSMTMSLEQSPRAPSSSRGFTLIELLVVISILTILAALFFPVVGNARKQGEIATCKSNLRQLHVAANFYSSDHDGEMVMGFTGSGQSRGVNFSVGLVPYIGTVANNKMNIMHCPTQFKIMMSLPASQRTTFTYSENHQFTSEAFGYSDAGAGGRTNMIPVNVSWMNASSVRTPPERRPATPATVPYFMDGWHRDPQGAFITWRHWALYGHIASGGGEKSLSDSWPHNWKANVVFLDGHVELNAIKQDLWDGDGLTVNGNKRMLWEFTQGPKGYTPFNSQVIAF
jgi:prepilin-type N-terminal cleavage/methylation domain-containing protein/prepilin-type processing-associated H-X9-DG protein